MILPFKYLERFSHYECTPKEGWSAHYTQVKLYYNQWWRPFPKTIKIQWSLRGSMWYETQESLQLRQQLATYFYQR